MRGLPIFQGEGRYQNAERKTVCSGVRRWFCIPPTPEPTPQYRDEKEKKYHHTPTHAGSSFAKTATTPAMILAIEEQAKLKEEAQTAEEKPPTATQIPPSDSII
ncbi:uncharacterized protein BP5553_08434 [Venustampulla echinocandica]|uniref:Uncharacterized protein n=1 Tax=Venustampulla echinocandica TaxID=2656787 RepID=A0A370TE77_9HELO|nr:uncharacterized protein BP5553_08434 [Venustampulla echinocandica]RDL32995.1 hypothetical protein BP5553_08434 [Venustampulla echinocandica]